MNWDAISGVTEVIGVILIVASLIYLARQVHQNNEMLRSSARQATLDAELDGLNSLIDHPIDLVNLDGAKLTEAERLRVHYLLLKILRAREFYWLQRQSGVLDEATWASNMAPVRAVFSSNLARQLLEEYTGDPGFKAYLTSEIG